MSGAVSDAEALGPRWEAIAAERAEWLAARSDEDLEEVLDAVVVAQESLGRTTELCGFTSALDCGISMPLEFCTTSTSVE